MPSNEFDQTKVMIAHSIHLLLLLSNYKGGELFFRTADYKRISTDDTTSVYDDAVNDALAANPLYFEYEILMEFYVEPGLDIQLEKNPFFHNVEIVHMSDGSSVIRALATPKDGDGKYRLSMVHGKNYAHAVLNSHHRNTRNAMRVFCSKCRGAVRRAKNKKAATSESR